MCLRGKETISSFPLNLLNAKKKKELKKKKVNIASETHPAKLENTYVSVMNLANSLVTLCFLANSMSNSTLKAFESFHTRKKRKIFWLLTLYCSDHVNRTLLPFTHMILFLPSFKKKSLFNIKVEIITITTHNVRDVA